MAKDAIARDFRGNVNEEQMSLILLSASTGLKGQQDLNQTNDGELLTYSGNTGSPGAGGTLKALKVHANAM